MGYSQLGEGAMEENKLELLRAQI